MVLWIIEWFGDNFVLYLWVFVSIVIFAMMWIVPTVIMPCFYKFETLSTEHLNENTQGLIESINALASRLQFPLKKVFVMDGSKRSSHSNAFQYGFCSNKRIVLFDTLLTQTNTDEITAILGHELGHWKFSHTVKHLILSEIQLFIIFALFQLCYKDARLYNAFGFGSDSQSLIIIGLYLFGYLWAPVSACYVCVQNAITRHFEFEADAFAARELGFKEAIYSGLVKIHDENKANLNPDWLYSAYHHSHPPLIQRLQAIEDLAKKAA